MTTEFELAELGELVKQKIKKMFDRSLQIREVDAGSCNGCDYEINAVNNSFNDIERFGIHFVASPRHADMLLVTGCAARNMEQALLKTYEATPEPKLVVAVGACACSGGIFQGYLRRERRDRRHRTCGRIYPGLSAPSPGDLIRDPESDRQNLIGKSLNRIIKMSIDVIILMTTPILFLFDFNYFLNSFSFLTTVCS